MTTKLGVALWAQATDWPAFEAAAVRIDRLGYDSVWTWDHLYAIFGDPYQPIFEGYTTLAAWAKLTSYQGRLPQSALAWAWNNWKKPTGVLPSCA